MQCERKRWEAGWTYAVDRLRGLHHAACTLSMKAGVHQVLDTVLLNALHSVHTPIDQWYFRSEIFLSFSFSLHFVSVFCYFQFQFRFSFLELHSSSDTETMFRVSLWWWRRHRHQIQSNGGQDIYTAKTILKLFYLVLSFSVSVSFPLFVFKFQFHFSSR